jgi:hypothetical protein
MSGSCCAAVVAGDVTRTLWITAAGAETLNQLCINKAN